LGDGSACEWQGPEAPGVVATKRTAARAVAAPGADGFKSSSFDRSDLMAIKQVRFVKHTSYGAYYNAGEVAGFEHEQAAELVKGGHAEFVVGLESSVVGQEEAVSDQLSAISDRLSAISQPVVEEPTFSTDSTLEDVRDVVAGRRPKGKK
jgi:hypothetical protein